MVGCKSCWSVDLVFRATRTVRPGGIRYKVVRSFICEVGRCFNSFSGYGYQAFYSCQRNCGLLFAPLPCADDGHCSFTGLRKGLTGSNPLG